MHIMSLFVCQYFFQSLMDDSDLVQSPENVNGRLPINLSPGLLGPGCSTAGLPPPFPLPPPPPPPPPPGGTPPGIPGFPLKGVLVDQKGSPCPENGCAGGSGRSGWRAQKAAMLSFLYMWLVRGLIDPALMVCIVVCTSVIGKSSIWRSAANLAIASAASVWCTLITQGKLLCSDRVAGHDGVVFSGGGAGSQGASCWAIYQSKLVGVMLSPKSGPAIQNASQCPPCSKFSCQ